MMKGARVIIVGGWVSPFGGVFALVTALTSRPGRQRFTRRIKAQEGPAFEWVSDGSEAPVSADLGRLLDEWERRLGALEDCRMLRHGDFIEVPGPSLN